MLLLPAPRLKPTDVISSLAVRMCLLLFPENLLFVAIITLVNAGFSWSSSHQASQSCLLVFASHSCVPQTAPAKTTVSTILSTQLFSLATLLLVPTTGPPFPPFLSRPSFLEALSSGTIHDLPPGRYTGHRCGAGTRQHKEIQGDYRASFSFLPSPIYHVLT